MMIPGICNVCQETLFGSESRSHIARCVETRYGLRATRAALKGRRRTVHISVGSPEHPHWMELGVRADTTLHELDGFLRSVWLECCGHLSHFDIAGVVYSMMVPRPGDDFEFEPMDEHEEQWRHMGRTVGTAIKPATWFEHQYDYGTTTDLDLRHAGEFEGLVQVLSPMQPWHGRKIVVLARNHPLQSCCQCGRPAHWRIVSEEDEYDDPDDELVDLDDNEFLFWDGDRDDDEVLVWDGDWDDEPHPVTYCDECAPVDAAFTVLPNSPREGANCYDNVHSWRTWPLDDE